MPSNERDARSAMSMRAATSNAPPNLGAAPILAGAARANSADRDTAGNVSPDGYRGRKSGSAPRVALAGGDPPRVFSPIARVPGSAKRLLRPRSIAAAGSSSSLDAAQRASTRQPRIRKSRRGVVRIAVVAPYRGLRTLWNAHARNPTPDSAGRVRTRRQPGNRDANAQCRADRRQSCSVATGVSGMPRSSEGKGAPADGRSSDRPGGQHGTRTRARAPAADREQSDGAQDDVRASVGTNVRTRHVRRPVTRPRDESCAPRSSRARRVSVGHATAFPTDTCPAVEP